MKIKNESIVQATLLACTLCVATVIAGCFTGCGKSSEGGGQGLFFITGSTNTIENKAYRVARVVTREVIKDRGTNAIPKLVSASDDLQLLADSPQITAEQVLEVLNRAKVIKNPDTAFYVTEGVLLMTDDLGTVGAQNPEQLRAAARGGKRGIDSMLAALAREN